MTKRNNRFRLLTVLAALAMLVSLPFPLNRQVQAASVSSLQSQLDKLEKEEQSIKQSLAKYKNDLSKQQEYADSLKKQIANTTAQIDLLEDQMNLLNTQITQKNEEIAGKDAQIAQKQADLDAQFELLGERLRAISQTGNLSALQMLLNTDDFIDYLLRDSITERVAASDQRLMDEMEAQIEGLDADKQALETERGELNEQKEQLAAVKKTADEKKKELDTLYAESNAVVKKLQGSVNAANQDLKKNQQEAAALEKQIQSLLQSSSSSSGSYTGNYTDGTMFWPVPTVRNLSDVYGPRWGTMHRGIDIANGSIPIYGQNIVAAADGVVIYANKSGYGGGYGLFVMIDHGLDSRGRRIVTLYAHCSQVLVNVGDKVTGGQSVIAKAGASGNVTGPHLHFEVRVDGTAVDPIANGYVSRSK